MKVLLGSLVLMANTAYGSLERECYEYYDCDYSTDTDRMNKFCKQLEVEHIDELIELVQMTIVSGKSAVCPSRGFLGNASREKMEFDRKFTGITRAGKSADEARKYYRKEYLEQRFPRLQKFFRSERMFSEELSQLDELELQRDRFKIEFDQAVAKANSFVERRDAFKKKQMDLKRESAESIQAMEEEYNRSAATARGGLASLQQKIEEVSQAISDLETEIAVKIQAMDRTKLRETCIAELMETHDAELKIYFNQDLDSLYGSGSSDLLRHKITLFLQKTNGYQEILHPNFPKEKILDVRIHSHLQDGSTLKVGVSILFGRYEETEYLFEIHNGHK